MTSIVRTTAASLALLALAHNPVHAQASSRTPPPICRQSNAPAAETIVLGDDFSVKGAGMREVDGRTQWVWTGEQCSAWIRVSPGVDTNATGGGLLVPSGASFEAFQRDTSGVREITVSSAATRLRVDGRDVLPTVADNAWLADMTLEYARRAGRHANERALGILRTGGVSGILAEAAEISAPRVRVRYLMVAVPAVADAERAAFLTVAARLLDHGAAWLTLVSAVPASWRADEQALAAIYAGSESIDQNEIVERILERFPPPLPVPTGLRPLVEALINSMQTVERRAALRAEWLGKR